MGGSYFAFFFSSGLTEGDPDGDPEAAAADGFAEPAGSFEPLHPAKLVPASMSEMAANPYTLVFLLGIVLPPRKMFFSPLPLAGPENNFNLPRPEAKT
jgi:hypothetical protein